MIIKKHKSVNETIYCIFLIIIKVTLVVAIIGSIYQGLYEILFLSLLTLFLVYTPLIFEKTYNINIPLEIESLIVIIIYASLFLGSVKEYYLYFWWWDLALHIGSSLLLGFIGFMILYILYKENKVKAGPFLLSIFSFFFALGIGGLWEIFEFGMDRAFDINMQGTGLFDTMGDLIMDGLGALVASIGGYFYLKGNEHFLFRKLINRFFYENPHIFKSFKSKRRLERKIKRLERKQEKLRKKIQRIKKVALQRK